ncbi:MAG: GNAT family N-acetyltransferase [Spirirestis rafaelensis WJT71-NPBG6]|jgi:GNAT superfamily N-acetyltransferase|nr:GNAT family N-acetyltransferase [Spirirestis rafaelensis WJT71-NPBG6]
MQNYKNQYRFQRSFAEDAISDRLFNLLEIVFPEIRISDAAQVGRMLAASWESASTPFMRLHDDMAISHVGVLEIPMQLMGESIIAGGIHGVCTHPEFRRRGYYREIMQEVLDYCNSRYDTLVLTTAQPELYQPFGFRVVGEHIFIAKCNSLGGTDGFRLIDTSNTNDVKLLHRLLETREPVSNILGIVKEKAVFFVNEGRNPLYYAEDLDVIICMEIKDTQLHLFDVVGTRICTLAEILERINIRIQEVVIYFSPDRLNADVQALSHILDGDSLLMVRGNFAAEGEKFMLPRSARC